MGMRLGWGEVQSGVTCPIDWIMYPIGTCQSGIGWWTHAPLTRVNWTHFQGHDPLTHVCQQGTGRNCAPLTRVNGARMSTKHVTPVQERSGEIRADAAQKSRRRNVKRFSTGILKSWVWIHHRIFSLRLPDPPLESTNGSAPGSALYNFCLFHNSQELCVVSALARINL